MFCLVTFVKTPFVCVQAVQTGWAKFVEYALAGGSFLGEFIDISNDKAGGATPMLSWRMQDRQFASHPLDGPVGFATLSQFWYEHANDSSYMVKPFNASASVPSHTATMNWAHQEVVEYHRSLLLELLSQHNDTIGGVELDYERDPAFFKDTEPQQQRNAVMYAFVRAARAAVGAGRSVGLRVPSDETNLDSIGLPIRALSELLQTGVVDYVTMGIGFFGFQPGVSDFAHVVSRIRNITARGQILFEVTSMLRYGCTPPAQALHSVRDRMPPLALVTAAHLAFTAGADGIAAFNFAYYRSFEGKTDIGHEPPFSVLASLRNRTWTATQPQLYFLSHAGNHTSHTPSSRMPQKLSTCTSEPCALSLEMAPPTNGWESDGVLRLNFVKSPWVYSTSQECPSLDVAALTHSMHVSVNGLKLHGVANVPDTARWSSWPDASFASFLVPKATVKRGRNIVSLLATSPAAANLTLIHLELSV